LCKRLADTALFYIDMNRGQDSFLVFVQKRLVAQWERAKVSRLLDQDMYGKLGIVRGDIHRLEDVEASPPDQAH
jgi:hypothetical protein